MPLQVMRCEDYSEKVDVYSYAMVLWFMIHGDRPLVGTLEKDFISAAENDIALRPTLGNVTYAPLKDLMQKCWEANPVGRMTAAQTVLDLKAMQLPKNPKQSAAKRSKGGGHEGSEGKKKCVVS